MYALNQNNVRKLFVKDTQESSNIVIVPEVAVFLGIQECVLILTHFRVIKLLYKLLHIRLSDSRVGFSNCCLKRRLWRRESRSRAWITSDFEHHTLVP